MEEVCKCKDPNPRWQLEHFAHENGWFCADCDNIIAGEPNGYRPDLDRSEIIEKVDSVLFWLHQFGFLYMSNSSHGEVVVEGAANRCRKVGMFDQATIIHSICHELMGHAHYWKKIGEGVLSGNDQRDRCELCGKLATVWADGRDYCSEHQPKL